MYTRSFLNQKVPIHRGNFRLSHLPVLLILQFSAAPFGTQLQFQSEILNLKNFKNIFFCLPFRQPILYYVLNLAPSWMNIPHSGLRSSFFLKWHPHIWRANWAKTSLSLLKAMTAKKKHQHQIDANNGNFISVINTSHICDSRDQTRSGGSCLVAAKRRLFHAFLLVLFTHSGSQIEHALALSSI